MGKEFELKYAATPPIQCKIAEKYGDFLEISMETTYYDTPARDFSARKMTLRRRLENGVSLCTLKAPAGPHSRREWEVEAPTVEAAIPELCKLSRWDDLARLTHSGLHPICGARFLRRAKLLSFPDCTLELALDSGVLTAGSRALPLCEVEVELKSGSEAAALVFAAELAGEFSLTPEPKSKFRRALELSLSTDP